MSEVDLSTIYSRVKRFGGGFEQALVEAISRADSSNRFRLKQAFPDFFEKWSDPIWDKQPGQDTSESQAND